MLGGGNPFDDQFDILRTGEQFLVGIVEQCVSMAEQLIQHRALNFFDLVCPKAIFQTVIGPEKGPYIGIWGQFYANAIRAKGRCDNGEIVDVDHVGKNEPHALF